VNQWISYLEKNLNYSSHTLIAYRKNVIDFIAFSLKNQKSECHLQDILNFPLEKFQNFLEFQRNNHNLTHRSLSRILSAIKNFYVYQEKYVGLVNERLKHFSIRYKNKAIPHPITQYDLDDILDYLKSESHIEEWVCYRNYVLCLLLYGCGLRISEALSLTLKDIETSQKSLRIIGKGNKQRLVPYLDIIREAFKNYLQACPHLLELNDYVFVGLRGKQLAARQFYQILINAHDELNIPYHFSAHSFRHSCASHLLNDGANLRCIQSLLGHKSLSSTEYYLKVDYHHLRDIIEKAHPRK
jgi:integrase/recombinase XerC